MGTNKETRNSIIEFLTGMGTMQLVSRSFTAIGVFTGAGIGAKVLMGLGMCVLSSMIGDITGKYAVKEVEEMLGETVDQAKEVVEEEPT